MTTYLTETRKTHTNPGNPSDPWIGQEILTITLWADGERIQNFGGQIDQDETVVRAKAAEAANKWDGLTGADVRSYDAFIREMDRKNWSL